MSSHYLCKDLTKVNQCCETIKIATFFVDIVDHFSTSVTLRCELFNINMHCNIEAAIFVIRSQQHHGSAFSCLDLAVQIADTLNQ
jgi:hypothetical protein